MSTCHLLTRLLLIASLILNGSGLGLVSAGDMAMPSPPSDGDQVVAEVSAGHDVNPPCHESMDQGDTRGEALGAQPSSPGHAKECCESGSCLHACHPLAPAAMTLAFLPSVVIESQQASGTLASAHGSPALHRLIRPPIA